MLKIARGWNQAYALSMLFAGYRIHRFDYGLRGSAASYGLQYTKSWRGFMKRLHDAGFVCEIKLGPKGGVGSATYRLIGDGPSRPIE